jgi:integrase
MAGNLPYLWYAKDIYPFYRREGWRTPLTDPAGRRLLKGDFGEKAAWEIIHATFISEKNTSPRDVIIPGSLRHGIVEYRKSPEWGQLAPNSRIKYDLTFNWLLEPPGIPENADPKKPATLRHKGHGHRPLASMDEEVVIVLRDLRYNPPEDMRYQKKSQDEEKEPPRVFPGSANDLLGALGALFAFVKLRRRQFLLPRGWTSPTDDVPGFQKGEGHRPWEEDEIDQFCTRWPLKTPQRAIRDVFLDTGQRGVDVWKMRREHFRRQKRRRDDLVGLLVSDREISVVQQKTRVRVWVPASNELIPSVDWLLSSHDGAWFFMTEARNHMSQRQMTKILTDAISEAGLPADCTPHGLRVTFATRIIETGLDYQTIESIVGHTNMAMAIKYTEKRRKGRLAIATLNVAMAARRAGQKLLVDE